MVLPLIFLSLFTFISLSTEFTAALDALSPNQTLANAAGGTLVSADESFELGFFSPPNSGNRYVGIWFKQVSLQTPIWVANKDNPVTDTSGVLTISPTGNIIITSNQTNLIWFSNSTMLSASPVLQLLDTGNLVVVNSNTGSYLWQSFDHPCDTLVPGMNLGWDISKNQEWYLTSWNSLQDPSTGDYTYRVDPRGLPQLVLRRGSTISYRSGPWDGVRFGGGPPLTPMIENTVISPNFVYNTTFVYYSFVNVEDTIISRFVVNQTGLLEHLTWNRGSGKWVDIITLQADSCDTYDLCGPYAICNINEIQIAICHCMDGFVPKVPVEWNRLDWSGGCVAKTELNCTVAVGFRRFSSLKLPDTSYFLMNRTEISRVDCEEACLKNCSCMGFAQTDISGWIETKDIYSKGWLLEMVVEQIGKIPELYKLFIDLYLKESTENEEWSEYIQANSNAKQFRYTGLQYSNELKALFDGVRAIGRFSWGPSKEGFPTDGTQSQSQMYINLDIGSLETPSSPNGDAEKHGNKRQKKSKSDDLDKQLLEALHTLQSSDGPTLEECNRILDEMQPFDMSDPLYIVACRIFCESKAHREQWMLLHQKPEVVRKSRIELNGNKLGLL
ncbi:hypothetical protein RHGRI_037399 [Rhododendron griersonianum]|uniref:Bulb-type lectin domain-containing protein n=1 Tax=Rhododendron griersonianum TaxID=479676 RepID=A0AAV6HRJ0_9ERIC|nr:hypothetical protein RHGRI_037399 [Rhododendron griersonianum]